VSHGWHFNAPDPSVAGGRPGEPWLLVDRRTATLLPISSRHWPGTHRPDEVGLTDWQFLLLFGRHTPGGGFGEPTPDSLARSPKRARWAVSGPLEIDCMFCHSADQQHDPAQAAAQIEAENFRWSATVALGLAVVRGQARKASDDWDPLMPPDPDFPERAGPTLIYDQSRFDADGRVFFNITRRPSVERCYFCHSFRLVGLEGPDEQLGFRDVHLAAGLICVDCHRNGIDHRIIRGYEAEAGERGEPSVAAFTCAGCHLGSRQNADDSAVKFGGLYGAPRPEHRGLPPVHLEKLACTACHAGPWPEMEPKRFQTAMAHGLGLAARDRSPDQPPEILGPIFARQPDGKIAPQRAVWPAFWGVLDAKGVRPILPDRVRELVGDLLPAALPPDQPLTPATIAQALQRLTGHPTLGGEPLYVRDGRMYRQTASGNITESVHPVAAAYRWSIAHDVRPASQSLGAGGCTDCHADHAPIYFGRAGGSRSGTGPTGRESCMHELRNENPVLIQAWALAFRLRPAFKWFGLACASLIGLILLRFGLDLSAGRRPYGMSNEPADQLLSDQASRPGLTFGQHVLHLVAIAGLLVQGVTGLWAWLTGDGPDGWLLLAHMLGAPLFVLGLTGIALQWAGRCRFVAGAVRGANQLSPAQKSMFWAILWLGFAVMLSALAAMEPIFGQAGLETLSLVHRLSAVALLVCMLPHTAASLVAHRYRR